MGKLTYLLHNERDFRRAHVLIDGTDVHASHPRGEPRIVTFKAASDKEALAKFQDVIKTHFHPRDGWKLEAKKPGVAEYPEFPKPPTEEELAAERAKKEARKLGYAQDGAHMVIDLSRQRTVGDLEIALERAAEVTDLTVLTVLDDEDGASAHAFFSRLETAVPKLKALALDCPWETLTRAAAVPLPGLGGFIDKRRDLERLHVTGQAVWSRPLALPKLTSLALCADPLDAEALKRLTKKSVPALTTLHLGLSVEGEPEEEAVAAVAKLPLAQLETLTVEGLLDVEGMITLLLAQDALPKLVQLDGGVTDGEALVTLVKRWKKDARAKLALGESAFAHLDEDAHAALEKLVDGAYGSPFAPEGHDARARELWARIA